MSVKIFRTPRADQQLRSRAKGDQKKIIAFLRDLEVNGCAALSYRLTGADPLERLCDKHLGGRLRVIVAFESPQTAWVLLVADHDDSDPDFNIYSELYRLVGHEPESSEKRTKPPCCSEDGSAPAMGQAAESLALKAIEIRKTRR
ncbi:hypothetical protein [Paractinoplanes toevensis]|uniref:Uncharacterized protein n=1 Tax=Paractinoplanes toevensis TaxID=571911 RepID=A0A919TDN5_9ACTN|nr:hypothetical protein [Actinoplanes toevensis]GIM93698.1 hypothetical protein Ato02nite_054910 [Actinoplanes toevensis]